MQGNVLKYDKETHKGLISGHDGTRYSFTKIDWHSDKDPAEGFTVDFDVNGKEAKDIVLLRKTGKEIEKVPLLLWTFFLGWMGAHHFYLGNKQAWIYLLLFWSGFPALVAFCEFFYFLFMGKEKFDRKFNY